MILYGFLGFIALACATGVLKWRLGVLALLVIGALQDPVRKMVPGTPGFLALSTIPVWTSIIAGAFLKGELRWSRFRRLFPEVSVVTVIFIWALVPSAVISLTYAPGSWQITLLGVFAYFTAFAGILLGIFFPENDGDTERLLVCYILIVAVMLIGAPMERLGIGMSTGAVGTERLGNFWITYRTGGALRMMAGFYRSPDILGWHAGCMVMLSLTLAMRRIGWQRYLFVALAGWGGVALMLCARRKMISGVALFLVIFLVLFLRHRQARRILGVVFLSLAAGGVWFYLYQKSGSDQEVEKFYSSTISEAGDRFYQHAVKAAIVTVDQAGPFGYGLGMAVQGAHHINVERPNIWQEGGVSKLLAEVGVPGALAVVVLLIGFFRAGLGVLRRVERFPHAVVYFGLAALLASNILGAVVSAQVYGDPFIGTLLPFMGGLLLSGIRLGVAEEDRIGGKVDD